LIELREDETLRLSPVMLADGKKKKRLMEQWHIDSALISNKYTAKPIRAATRYHEYSKQYKYIE